MSTVRQSRFVAAFVAVVLGCSGGTTESAPTSPPPASPTPTPTPVLSTIGVTGAGSVAAGSTLQLTASPKDQNGNAIAATISWSSNATSVATVSNSGLVTGVAAGSAVITAASGSISSSATITVTVTPVLTTIAISGGTSVVAGSTLQLTASPKDQNGNAMAATITWSSNAPSVATVSGSGLVTGVAAGSATITAASGSVSGSATITVTASAVLTTITISGGTSVEAGSTLQLTASPKDQNGNPFAATIIWSSNATSVATVSSNGLVTGVAAGSATITAASGSVSGSASITVTVTPVLTTIIISGGTTVVAGSTLQLTASPKDQNGDPIAATISWSSNATSVATVNSSGLVTGVAAGSANIKATSGLVNASVGVTVTAPVYPLSATVNATISSTFAPATIDIARTGTITWAFSSVTHDVTFTSPGAPANIPATANTSISRVFNTAGTFGYQCTIHAGMTGVVIVH